MELRRAKRGAHRRAKGERERERMTHRRAKGERLRRRSRSREAPRRSRSREVSIAISWSVYRDLAKHRADRDLVKRLLRSREAPRRLQSREASITILRSVDRDLAKHRANRSPLSNPVVSLCSFFSQFDRIWWFFFFFFSGFCLCFCIEEWMILYIYLATEKMWPDLMIFFFWVLFVFLYWGMNDIIYSFGNQENVSNK